MIVDIAARKPDRRTASDEAGLEAVALRAERSEVAHFLRLVGGRVIHLIEAEQLVAAHTEANRIVDLGIRLQRRNSGGDAA